MGLIFTWFYILMKKIWVFCLCLASISIAGCFHIPDEDWLLNNNEVETWNVEKVDELEQAVNSLKEWINIASTQRNNMKNNDEQTDWELNQINNEEVNQNNEITRN